MKLNISYKDIWSAGLLLFIGIFTVVFSINYKIGTLSYMGPGYYPLILGIVLIILGLLIFFTAEPVTKNSKKLIIKTKLTSRLKTWIIVISSILLFIVVGKYIGLVVATFVLTSLAAMADKSNTLKTCLIVGLILTIMTVAIFHYGLKLQFPLFV